MNAWRHVLVVWGTLLFVWGGTTASAWRTRLRQPAYTDMPRFAAAPKVTLKNGRYMIKSAAGDGVSRCLIFNQDGKAEFPDRYSWGENNTYCGFPSLQGLTPRKGLLKNKQAVWWLEQVEGNKFLIKSEAGPKGLLCLAVSANGVPERHAWGEDRANCGFGSTNDLLRDGHAVWSLVPLGGNKYLVKNTRLVSPQCLGFDGKGLDQYPQLIDFSAPAPKANTTANRTVDPATATATTASPESTAVTDVTTTGSAPAEVSLLEAAEPQLSQTTATAPAAPTAAAAPTTAPATAATAATAAAPTSVPITTTPPTAAPATTLPKPAQSPEWCGVASEAPMSFLLANAQVVWILESLEIPTNAPPGVEVVHGIVGKPISRQRIEEDAKVDKGKKHKPVYNPYAKFVPRNPDKLIRRTLWNLKKKEQLKQPKPGQTFASQRKESAMTASLNKVTTITSGPVSAYVTRKDQVLRIVDKKQRKAAVTQLIKDLTVKSMGKNPGTKDMKTIASMHRELVAELQRIDGKKPAWGYSARN